MPIHGVDFELMTDGDCVLLCRARPAKEYYFYNDSSSVTLKCCGWFGGHWRILPHRNWGKKNYSIPFMGAYAATTSCDCMGAMAAMHATHARAVPVVSDFSSIASIRT
jgi:hypothetical protein